MNGEKVSISRVKIIQLANSMLVGSFTNTNCTQRDENDKCNKWEYSMIDLLVDVNGVKKPNILGKDIFIFSIDQDKVGIKGKCYKIDEPRDTILKKCKIDNAFCSCLFINDGLKFSDDYPLW